MSTTNGASHRYVVNRHDAGRSADAEIDETLEELREQFGDRALHDGFMRCQAGAMVRTNTQETLRIINYVLGKIIDSPRPRLEADAMGIATGYMLRMRMSIRDLAKKYGITPAAISKRAVEFSEETGLPPSGCMRPERDRETYALTNRTRV